MHNPNLSKLKAVGYSIGKTEKDQEDVDSTVDRRTLQVPVGARLVTSVLDRLIHAVAPAVAKVVSVSLLVMVYLY